MKLLKLTFLFIIALIGSMQAQSAETARANVVSVQLEPGVSITTFLHQFNQQERDLGQLVVEKTVVQRLDFYLLRFDANRTDATTVRDRLMGYDSAVRWANVPVAVQERDTIPNDFQWEEQWNMTLIQANRMWDLTTGGNTSDEREIVIAVMDSGFDISHPDFAGNIWENPNEIPGNDIDDDQNGYIDDVSGWDFRTNSPTYLQDSYHGNAVAGIAGAKGNNEIGVAGINWNVKLMFIGCKYTSEIVEAYEYIYQMRKKYNETNGEEGAFVVVTNASFGINEATCTDYPLWGEMYDTLGLAGVLSVASTTNLNTNVDIEGDMPTDCPSDFLLTVNNINNIELLVSSGTGVETIDMGAPGGDANEGIYTLSLNGQYATNFGGTSAAAPHVSGAIGLLYAIPCNELLDLLDTNPAKAAEIVSRAVLESVEKIPALTGVTKTEGRLDLLRASAWLRAWCDNPSDAPITFDNYLNGDGLYGIYQNEKQEIIVEFGVDDTTPITIFIYDMLGRFVTKAEAIPTAFSARQVEFSNINLANGIYIAAMHIGDEVISKKFVVTEQP